MDSFDFSLFCFLIGELLVEVDPEGAALQCTDKELTDMTAIIQTMYALGASPEDTAIDLLTYEIATVN